MAKFVDEVIIEVEAGHGGSGATTFHSEKFVEFGGPDGGDGGKGGDVFIQSDSGLQTLDKYLSKKHYKAEAGHAGARKLKSGLQGQDITLKVPVGTQVIDNETGEILIDLVENGQSFLLAKGGRGGKGNAYFKSSTHQTPRFSQPGEPGEIFEIKLSLKLLADIGIVGLPNAGKSTLLSKITEAHPKIAGYAFTTLIPNLGVVIRHENTLRYTIADIPGIIEGASRGVGLGLSFLRHIERVKGIIYVFDTSTLDVEADLKMLQHEMASYNKDLSAKPHILVLNKIDEWNDPEFTNEVLQRYSHLGKMIPISAKTETGLNELLDEIDRFFQLID